MDSGQRFSQFQSTPPRREVTSVLQAGERLANISIHTSPKGGDFCSSSSGLPVPRFQSTPPRREVTRLADPRLPRAPISIHTSPKGGDWSGTSSSSIRSQFQSTPPRREVTRRDARLRRHPKISIHTSPKGGDRFEIRVAIFEVISIHTSPKGGDCKSEHRSPHSGRHAHFQPKSYLRKPLLEDARHANLKAEPEIWKHC